jgi:hypothetical protein
MKEALDEEITGGLYLLSSSFYFSSLLIMVLLLDFIRPAGETAAQSSSAKRSIASTGPSILDGYFFVGIHPLFYE